MHCQQGNKYNEMNDVLKEKRKDCRQIGRQGREGKMQFPPDQKRLARARKHRIENVRKERRMMLYSKDSLTEDRELLV